LPNTFKNRKILDHLKQLKLSELKKGGYLKPGKKSEIHYSWAEGSGKISTISIKLDLLDNSGRMTLNYIVNDRPVEGEIALVIRPSNLASNPSVWFMLCPDSNRLCRKLYFNGTRFIHRDLIGGLYESQTRSKATRGLYRNFLDIIDSDQLWNDLHKKHMKKTYKGKLTLRYKSLLNRNSIVDEWVNSK